MDTVCSVFMCVACVCPYRKPGLLKQFIDDLYSQKLHREFHQGPDPGQAAVQQIGQGSRSAGSGAPGCTAPGVGGARWHKGAGVASGAARPAAC
jgi:hypothetical protein